MEVGIIGLPLSGKTTIYNALTHGTAQTNAYSTGRCEVHTAVIDVPDPRVGVLAAMFRPRKTTRAKIQFNDVSGIAQARSEGGFGGQTLHAISKCDALLLVVRAFERAATDGPANPARDLRSLRQELILSDLGLVERRMERIQGGLRKARGAELESLQRELELMQYLQEALEQEIPVVDVELGAEDQSLVRGFQFLTAKPSLVVVNEAEHASDGHDLGWACQHRDTTALALKGSLEMELAQLPDDEMAGFLKGYGLAEPSLSVLVRECYRLLGLMSFFTVGEDEVRAWTLHRGAPAVEAAGAIHTDLARGFIRAEVTSYDDMLAHGTFAELRRQGKLRLEGKDYIVRDGDILNIRFAV